MNCFEARKEFAAFWRRTMPSAARAHLVEHLAACAQCDRSFRVFALSAPVVHSENQPETSASATLAPFKMIRPRRFATARVQSFARRESQQRPWLVAAAVAALLLIGVFSAWSSTQWPSQNFADSIAADTADGEGAGYSSDDLVTAGDAAAEDPAFFDSIAPDPSAPGNNGLAG